MVTGWKQSFLGDIITFQRGFDLPLKNRKEGNIPIVSSAGVTDFHDRHAISYPTVITGRCGTIGKLFFINSPCWPLNTTLYINNFNGNDIKFIYYFLNKIDFHSFSDKSGVPGINRNDLHMELVEYPISISEQQAIAAALSDVDELLRSLDQLIAKKKDIRLATMQELFTGKTRLPGFQISSSFQRTETGTIPGDWCFSSFGDIITKIVGGGTPKRDTPEFWEGDIPWATVKDFANFCPDKTQEYITPKGVSSSATHVISAGTLIIATRMALGKTALYNVDVAINQDLKAIIFNQNIDTKFMHCWFKWQEKNIQYLGSGSTVQGISINLLKKISIAIPSLAEQQAIASVLSDMDAEIEALEARRDKVRHIKAGMMQELLTGKTRLISSGEGA